MDISMTLPQRAYEGEELHRWARAVEDGPFASLSIGERVAYDDHDPLVVQSMIAALTSRIRLVTGVVVLTLRNATMFAKECASLDRLSGGRFVLGIGVGPRQQDFDATGASWGDRGRRFEEQLAVMKRVWQGRPPFEGTEPVGPAPSRAGGPEIHIGGFADVALRRAGRLADGLRSFDFAPEVEIHQGRYAIASEAWRDAGRTGRLRLIASTYFALGPDAQEVYERSMREYYGYEDAMLAWSLDQRALTTPEAIVDAIRRFEDAGVDEMGFATPAHHGVEAVERLAEVVARALP